MIGENSRYRRSVLVLSFDQAGNPIRRPWLDRSVPPQRRVVRGQRQYVVRQGDNWFNLAVKLYGDSRLWWVIAEANRVIDPFDALRPGDSIILPSRDVVFFDVLDFQTPDFREGAL